MIIRRTIRAPYPKTPRLTSSDCCSTINATVADTQLQTTSGDGLTVIVHSVYSYPPYLRGLHVGLHQCFPGAIVRRCHRCAECRFRRRSNTGEQTSSSKHGNTPNETGTCEKCDHETKKSRRMGWRCSGRRDATTRRLFSVQKCGGNRQGL